MFETQKIAHNNPDQFYPLLLKQLCSLLENETNMIANLSNASALLFDQLTDINWVGFYLMNGTDELILGPFQGKVACVHIRLGKGVCGTAAAEDQCQLVYDVHQFPGHIACDSASNSELVIPLHANQEVIGVLDIDSPTIGRFTQVDQDYLEQAAKIIEQSFTINS